MNAFSTAAALTLLAATATAVAPKTQEQSSPQSRSVPNAVPSPYQQQGTGVFGPFIEVGANSSSAACLHKRAAMKDAATSTAFAATAAQDGTTEVALAGLALQKSRNNQVRQFAQKMVQDYAQFNGELESIVKCEGLILPTELDTKHNALVRSLNAKSGSVFDKAYVEHMVKKNSEAVTLFESASKSGDPDVTELARKCLSRLQEHRVLADNLRAGVEIKAASTY